MLNALVAEGCFEIVEVGFLPVGHTHEDIDQSFSVLSQHLKKTDAFSFEAYKEAAKGAYKHDLDIPEIEYVNIKRDIKSWLEAPGVMIPSQARVGR